MILIIHYRNDFSAPRVRRLCIQIVAGRRIIDPQECLRGASGPIYITVGVCKRICIKKTMRTHYTLPVFSSKKTIKKDTPKVTVYHENWVSKCVVVGKLKAHNTSMMNSTPSFLYYNLRLRCSDKVLVESSLLMNVCDGGYSVRILTRKTVFIAVPLLVSSCCSPKWNAAVVNDTSPQQRQQKKGAEMRNRNRPLPVITCQPGAVTSTPHTHTYSAGVSVARAHELPKMQQPFICNYL